MSERAKSCYLRSNSDSLSTIYLPDSTPIFIGRSQETNITDTKCSRQQGLIYYNFQIFII